MDSISLPPAVALPVSLLLIDEGFGDPVQVYSDSGDPVTTEGDWELFTLRLLEEGAVHFTAVVPGCSQHRALVQCCVAVQVMAAYLAPPASNIADVRWAYHVAYYDEELKAFGGIFSLVVHQEASPA